MFCADKIHSKFGLSLIDLCFEVPLMLPTLRRAFCFIFSHFLGTRDPKHIKGGDCGLTLPMTLRAWILIFKRAILKQDAPTGPSLANKEPEQLVEATAGDAIEEDKTTTAFSELSYECSNLIRHAYYRTYIAINICSKEGKPKLVVVLVRVPD